jgi:hypothetical protein
MEFSAELSGLSAKDKSDGKKIEVKLIAQFDAALLTQLGNCFSDRVQVKINLLQTPLGFEEEK